LTVKSYLIATGCLAVVALLAACTATRAGYESAPYATSKTDGKFEIRDYPALTVASTSADSDAARDGSFMRLFRYISGQNDRSEKIAMTTPVFMGAGGEARKMSFVVPTEVAKKGAPAPNASDVKVEQLPAGRWAVFRFNGASTPANAEAALAKLREWMKAQQLTSSGNPVTAYFDPPWTPGPVRRNEVMLPLPAPAPAKP
jgi:DNA gyrase inhibitor GyrI